MFLLAGVWLPGAAEAQFPAGRSRYRLLQRWLRSEHEKVKEDSERLVAKTRTLRQEAEQHKADHISPEILERVRVLERQARALQGEVTKVDENFLSVRVVVLAEEIREEGKALQKYFSDNLPDRPGKKLSSLADDVEDRADDVADRMRLP